MRANKITLISILPVVLLSFSGAILASSGNPVVRLAWKPPAEILEYHSCGAADACWVAQVKNMKTKRKIATLRCDGEKLFSSVGKHAEVIAAEDCHRFESENKFQVIPEALRTLLRR